MGKNINGGNKNKKMARKQVFNTKESIKLRLSEDEFEKYAIVIRISGGSICRVKTNDSPNEIICHIRGKYRGRNKFSNLVSAGMVVLIGSRPDMTSKLECDLLYVYDNNQIESLAKYPEINITKLTQSFNQLNNIDIIVKQFDDSLIFSNEIVKSEYETNNNNSINDIVSEEIINIDDI